MNIVILGSGIIGVSTAYYLARAGHQVTVLDRQTGPALETSFANAGQVSVGYSAPWAAPGVPLKAIKWLLQDHSPLVIRPQLDPAMWDWLVRMLANCTEKRYAINKSRMLRLATYSRQSLEALRRDIGIEYDQRTQGTLQLFRTHKQLDGAAKDIAVLKQCGLSYELLDAAGCSAVEPALARVQGKFVGGLRLPGDETGDCFKFTQALEAQAAALGVEFRYGVSISGLERDGNTISGVQTAQGVVRGDAYVMALGSYSPLLLRPLGVRIPVYPVKGYSITVPITDPEAAPVSTVMDETYKIALTRLGDRIRVAGTAEISGYNLTLRPERRKTLEFVVNDLYPQGGDVSRAEFWTGLRPMTPDGTPLIGPTAFRNLYLNTGHGTLGWTMGAGSGRLLADLITGRRADIEVDGLTLDRYSALQPA